MKVVGIVTSIIGLIALIYTGINYINNSETFSMLGMDVAVSKGDPVPMVISSIVLIAGVLIMKSSKK
jgi:hypothetical protein